MTELILHHYSASPFSEKVRLVLGFKNLDWKSVIVPTALPKPDVVALTGGYRRTPFLQIGADVYCDSALMCRVIDRLAPEPPLYPDSSAGLADIVAQWADQALFWSAVPYTLQPAGVPHVLAGVTPEQLKAFRDDRGAMTSGMRRPSPTQAGANLRVYLDRLERQLAGGRSWLVGGEPSIADFAVAHSIWFIQLAPPVATLLEAYPRVLAWYERVRALGQAQATPLSSSDALGIAARATGHAPVGFTSGQGFDQDAEVIVTPIDYALDPVQGRLVGLGMDEVVIAREDPRAGPVHVHFPRIGYQIKSKVA